MQIVTTLYLDESKSHRYLLAAALLTQSDIQPARRTIDRLRRRGQRRIHFTKESDSRRRAILTELAKLGITAVVYEANQPRDFDSRTLCLQAVADDAGLLLVDRIVLEQDDSLVAADRRTLYTAIRAAGHPEISYEHARATAEPLLAIPDAIAWSLARGGEWRDRVAPLVQTVRRLAP